MDKAMTEAEIKEHEAKMEILSIEKKHIQTKLEDAQALFEFRKEEILTCREKAKVEAQCKYESHMSSLLFRIAEARTILGDSVETAELYKFIQKRIAEHK